MDSAAPSQCQFEHPGFAALGPLQFRLTNGDYLAALAIRVDGNDVVVPLHAIGPLFGLAPDSADARMLTLIEQALKFVPFLRLGDALPSEVVTGEASWEPSVLNHQVAVTRLQRLLVNWIGSKSASAITPQMLTASLDDPSVRMLLQEAMGRAGAELGIPGGGTAVAHLIEALAGELAFIEALRERLLDPIRGMVRRLGRASGDPAMSGSRRETLLQVTRLGMAALAQVVGRFEDVDGQTCEIVPALRNLERQRSFLRPHRDWLYSMLLAWTPLLRAWDEVPGGAVDEGLWKVIEESYRFLAPRYMAVQEWQSTAAAEKERAALVW